MTQLTLPLSIPNTWTLRGYQQEAIDKICDSFSRVDRVGAILPTGAGKTEIFIEVADWWHKKRKTPVLILSHLGLLTVQTKERFAKRKPMLRTGILQAGTYPPVNCQVVIGTMQTSRGDNHAEILEGRLGKVGLIIVDEAHYLYCDSYDKVFAKWPKAKILGVTATPFRNKQLMTGFFDEIAYSISLETLINEGHLVEPKLHEIVSKGEAPEETLAQTVAIYKDQQPNTPGIVYVDTIVNASLIRNMFEAAGIRARAVSSEITGRDREEIFKSFKEGHTQVLCNVNVLTAGFDGPRVRCIMMPFGVGSPTQYLQRIGRGLRTDEGKTHCDVYVFGRTPTIAGGLYQRYQREALTNKTVKEHETVFDDLQYGDLSKEEYVWTTSVIDAVTKMRDLGSERLADLLAHKDFPRKFMMNIAEMAKRMARLEPPRANSSPITDKQIEILVKNGFSLEKVKGWTVNEANIIVGLLCAPHTASLSNKWIFPSGRYAGRHVKDVPWAYKAFVATNMPDSPAAKLIREFHTSFKDRRKKDEHQPVY